MAIVRRACDAIRNCFPWSGDDTERIVAANDRVPPLHSPAALPDTAAIATVSGACQLEMQNFMQAMREQMKAEVRELMREQLQNEERFQRQIETLKKEVAVLQARVDKQQSQIESLRQQQQYGARTVIYPSSYRFENQESLPHFSE